MMVINLHDLQLDGFIGSLNISLLLEKSSSYLRSSKLNLISHGIISEVSKLFDGDWAVYGNILVELGYLVVNPNVNKVSSLLRIELVFRSFGAVMLVVKVYN